MREGKESGRVLLGMLARAGVVTAAAALCTGLTAGVALAEENASSATYENIASQGILTTDYVSSAKTLKSASNLPEALDLRHYNGAVAYNKDTDKQSTITGGINYVTPVKLQNPFQNCWAFSIIAAAETSMLTSLDKADDGQMNGSVDYEKAAAGNAGSLAQYASDLSERHLAYCVFTHPKSDGMYSSQAGEGHYLDTGDVDAASIMNVGGLPAAGISAFSCCIGPMPESVAPYSSDEGYISVYAPMLNTSKNNAATRLFTSYDEAKAYVESVWTLDVAKQLLAEINGVDASEVSDEDAQEAFDVFTKISLSSKGTWSVDDSLTYGTVAELTNSNLLETGTGDGLDQGEIDSMKRELAEGRPISIGFTADQSRPGETVAGNTYINTETWAQYTFNASSPNHAVTIVGYDDNYDKSNFTHTIYQYETDENGNPVVDPDTMQAVIKTDEDGNPIVDEEATAKTTPAHNGAWIVKNSWGSSDSSNPLDKTNWGVNGSGYFYLSYEDKTITMMESYEFDTSAQAQERTEYATAQYDVANANSVYSEGMDSEYKTCNVFDGDDGDELYKLRDVGCMTGVAGDTVTMEIYLMDDDEDAATVIANSEPVRTLTETFEHAGFHRVALEDGLVIPSDKKVAAVQTTKRPNGQYERTFFYGYGQNTEEAFYSVMGMYGFGHYLKTTVNEGESLQFANGVWSDWTNSISDLSTELTKTQLSKTLSPLVTAGQITQEKLDEIVQKAGAGIAIDNFSIKLYADKADREDQPVKNATVTKSYKAGKSGKLAAAKTISAKLAGVEDGAEVTYSKASAFSNVTMTVKVSKSGKATIVKGLPQGTYDLGSASGKAAKYFKVTSTGQLQVKKSAKGSLAAGTYKIKFKNAAATKYFKVSKAGKVTVKKGLAKGTYQLKVKCAVAKTTYYNAKNVYTTYKITVK